MTHKYLYIVQAHKFHLNTLFEIVSSYVATENSSRQPSNIFWASRVLFLNFEYKNSTISNYKSVTPQFFF